jgi:hypothetical protein
MSQPFTLNDVSYAELQDLPRLREIVWKADLSHAPYIFPKGPPPECVALNEPGHGYGPMPDVMSHEQIDQIVERLEGLMRENAQSVLIVRDPNEPDRTKSICGLLAHREDLDYEEDGTAERITAFYMMLREADRLIMPKGAEMLMTKLKQDMRALKRDVLLVTIPGRAEYSYRKFGFNFRQDGSMDLEYALT